MEEKRLVENIMLMMTFVFMIFLLIPLVLSVEDFGFPEGEGEDVGAEAVTTFDFPEGEGEDAGKVPEKELEEATGFKMETIEVENPELGEANSVTTIDATTSTYDEVQLTGTTSPDYTWNTNEGKISQFSMSNALFALGSLIQGSFLSFENNNNIFFGSVYDDSKFKATLDENGEIEVGQKNGFGETGRVYISMENGNLTQDDAIVFVPEGQTPTYIYYNTTEVEFEDGTVYLLGESVTNNDDTGESTTVEFDETGFTRLQLHPYNSYVIFDYSINNTGTNTIYVCKLDPMCDINIEGDAFKIKAEVDFYYQNEMVYESHDPNNEVEISTEDNSFSIYNPKPRNTILGIVYSGHHKITETKNNTYDMPILEEHPSLIKTYVSEVNSKEFTFDNDNTLLFNSFASYIKPQEVPMEAPEEEEKSNLWLYLLAIVGASSGLMIFFMRRS